MNDEEALFQAILDAPEDDAPRLVYADWIEERGQPERAEFIRVQIELARLPAGSSTTTRLKVRERQLLEEHKEAWVEPLMPLAFTGCSDDPCEFSRGFVEIMQLCGEDFVEQAPELFARTPLRVGIFPDEEEYDALAGCKYLTRFRELDFTCSGLSEHFGPSVLLLSRYLSGVEVLRLCGHDDNCHLDLPGLDALVRAKHLGKLRELDLSHNWFGDEGVEAFARADNLPSLAALALGGAGMTDHGLHMLVRSRVVMNLVSLELPRNRITDRGVEALLASRRLTRLTRVDLRKNEGITPAQQQALRKRFGAGVLL
jgi:uncharacterized protein (TIGR02996 family)